MHELLDELVRYHRQKAAILTEIQSLYPDVADDSLEARAELGFHFDSFRSTTEKAHHANEELILDALINAGRPIHPRIERTAEEHIIFGQWVQRLNTEISDPNVEPAIVVANVEWFLGQYDDHAGNEEAILFPAADQTLTPDAWARISVDWIDLS